ncbi:hypothetical protein EVS84_11785 [Pseudomonas koreensis]|uniref:Uncharacterized protein n=2 Tax=Pseudomonas TaxID=286 RepID=A0A4Q4L491_9PSED|nr:MULTISPECIES: hypothetical protein [Pseudomonas]MDM8191528.1 hypothetical protein [Pseudomonas fluorescens]MDP8572773.1 hypothetical protein [Pseudomonas iranensis]RYM41839.1 hypothetical protein EVS84_11785 [Pseudomonas koreensis]
MKKVFKTTPEEQIVGYSVVELKSIFGITITEAVAGHRNYPVYSALTPAGIQAYYSSFVIDKAEVAGVENLINERFSPVNERVFNGLVVTRFQHRLSGEQLILSISYKEFNSATIRLVTNSSQLLSRLSETKIAAPPPWLVFDGYEASWWGGDMQGAQGFYNDNYFFPFFSSLSPAERTAYYARYSAPEEWIRSLELTLDLE